MIDGIDVFNIEALNKKLSEVQKRTRQKEINDVGKILKTSEGRRYFWRLMDKCGVFRTSFTLNSNQTAFNEGMRDIGLETLRNITEADSSAFAQMQNEYVSALKSKKEARNDS